MTRLIDALSVTNDQWYGEANQYFCSHKSPGILLGYPILYLSQMIMDMTRFTDILSVTDDQNMTRLSDNLSVTNEHGYK